jgi:molybdopterin synthase catalytic subunit
VVVEMIKLTSDDFNVDMILRKLRTEHMGAIVCFVGVVRAVSKGREVARIEIQVYEDMAESQLEIIRNEAVEKFGVEEVVIIHRFGSLKVSENIMMIAAGAAHRAEAFDACRYVLENIKKRVPIWKKEITPEGYFWVEGEVT